MTTCKPGHWEDALPYRVKVSYKSRDGEEHRVRVRYWLNWLEIASAVDARRSQRLPSLLRAAQAAATA